MDTLESVQPTSAPFAGARVGDAEEPGYAAAGEGAWVSPTASPFAQGLHEAGESEAERERWTALVAELEDESFDEAVESLVEEVAGRHLSAASAWSAHEHGSGRAAQDASEWLHEVGTKADRMLAELEARYADRSSVALGQETLDEALGTVPAAGDPIEAASEQFLGGLVKKAFSAAKGLAKAGLSAVGRFLPLGKLFGLLRKLVAPLLKRVLATAINRLPVSLRGPAGELARKFAGASASETSEEPGLTGELDEQLAELLLAPTDAAAEQLLAEADAAAYAVQEHDPLPGLDAARARLARELAIAEPGQPPTAQMEQFIPAVMAALPLVRAGIGIVGRERVKGFLAKALATLIQNHVGPAAAAALAPRIADTGLRLLRLEAESPEQLGAEALVDTLEETITAVGQLPPSAWADPLRLESETAEAFAEAAGRLLPSAVLRPDLETVDTEADAEGEGWVLLPRGAGGCRRYRKLARVLPVVISRPRARAIVLGEDTLEERLLEAGVERWPVHGEAHVYETVLGTRLGHLAAVEREGAPVSVDEFEELTPEAAMILTGRPGLGRRVVLPGTGLVVGRRLVRLVVPGRIVRRRRHRIALRLDTSAAQPELRVHLRLGERSAHLLSGHLAKQALPDALGVARRLLTAPVRQRLAVRLTHHLGRAGGAPLPPDRGPKLAAQLTEALLAALSGQMPTRAAELEAAAKDPKPGLTLSFGFRFADKAALATGEPEAPRLDIRPGWHRD